MDPLSVAASLITLITAAGSIVQHLEHVQSRMTPHAELLAIMNTVTDLQATLIVVRYEYDAIGNSRIPAARLAYKALPDTIERLQQWLDQLVDFAHANLLKNGKCLSRLGLSKGKIKQLVHIRENISDAHRNLRLLLHSANLRRTQELMLKIEEAGIVQNENHIQTSTALDRIIAQLSAVHDLQGDNSKGHQHKQSKIRSVLEQTIYDGGDATSTQLRTTSMPLKACDWTCNYQCHVQTRSQTPRWLSAVIGTLFYCSTNTPSLHVRPCNIISCFRSQSSSSSRFTYYFPSWMMRAALVYTTWSNLQGANSSWIVKMPKEIPFHRPCWHYIQKGFVGKIQELLQSRQMSPYDIGPDGVSVLHWAQSFWQLEICSLLTTMGADWHFKDRSGRSPSDSAWRKILLNEPSNASVARLRALVGSEDSYDLQLGPLHRIIVGLSSADFQMQLDLEPSRINDRDWLGLTPLMWAALRGNHTCLNMLLSQGARIDLTDSEGRTAIHHAARAGSLQCVEALLNAGVDPNIADKNGLVPLHDAVYLIPNPEVKKIVTSLHGHGADLEARNENGWTPLFIATDLGSHEAVGALFECGANVNALDFRDIPPISRAIFRGDDEIVQLLCQRGIVTSWNSTDKEFNNVLAEAALFGTVKVMDILSDSAIPPVECNVTKLKSWFNTYRNDVYGTRRSPEEELAAFHRLLDKKAIPLDRAEASESSVAMKDELNKENGQDDGSDVDVFEDAMEDISFFDEPGLLAASPVVFAS